MANATTPEQKRQVVERIYQAWLRHPNQRLGQLLMAATQPPVSCVLYYKDDEALATAVEDFDSSPKCEECGGLAPIGWRYCVTCEPRMQWDEEDLGL